MSEQASDPRLVNTGWEIPTARYSDQPYVVITDDGAWLCVMTTGAGHEGQQGQHIITTRSTDHGRTWEAPVAVEPPDGVEASYAVLLKTPGGRIYCFYNHNTDDRRYVIADDPPYKDGKCYRVDSQGHFVMKYSDDHGQSWSAERYEIPIREMAIDRENAYGGEVQFFWNVGRPFTHAGSAYVSVHKVGGFGEGFFTRSEGVLLRSDNILTEPDPAQVRWETLPDGDAGLRTPPGGGPIAEEQSYSVLSDGMFYCVYRSIDGHPVYAYSRDGGHTWTEPRYKAYANGKLMKHPRAANFAWKCENGHFLYWYHNHGGNWYEDRNPVWLCGGVEVDSPDGRVIQWSQPEIVLYDDDTYIRMSYPDLVEDGGHYYLTETQKDAARVHPVDPALLAGLWGQFDAKPRAASAGCILEFVGDVPHSATLKPLPEFTARDHTRADYGQRNLRTGFTLEFDLTLYSLEAGQILLDKRAETGQGLCVQTTARETIEIILNDGRTENRWDCDPGLLQSGQQHHIVIIVDSGPRLILFVVDGVLCDGGAFRQFGWGRFSPQLRHVSSKTANRSISPGNQAAEADTAAWGAENHDSNAEQWFFGPNLRGRLLNLRVYDRALRVSEAIGNYQAER